MKSMPFYSQMANWDDEDSGFPDQDSIQQWEPNCCGIACLRMILAYYGASHNNNERNSYWNLLQLGIARGAYSDKGWIHRGLLEMAEEYGIQGQCHRQKDVEHVIDAVQRDSVCIVSVTRYFMGGQNDENDRPLPKGGHLVVAYDTFGGDNGITGIVCNHPSSGRQWNKVAWKVEIEKWEKSFSGNYIEFFSSQLRSAG
jgi:Peptidase_C39 like family